MRFAAKDFYELSVGELYEILKSRTEVFLLEQNIVCMDMDDVDYDSRHYFYEEDGRVVAYLRAYYDAERQRVVHVGRVLTLQHGVGLGRALMEASIADIVQKMPCDMLTLHSQEYAIGFYEKFGFVVVSDTFMEEGIPHVEMIRKIDHL